MRLLPLVLLFTLGACSSLKKEDNRVVVLDVVDTNCRKVAVLKSAGFSVIPFLGRSIAKSLIEDRAKDFKANAVRITKSDGFFYSELEADGYQCREVAPIKI